MHLKTGRDFLACTHSKIQFSFFFAKDLSENKFSPLLEHQGLTWCFILTYLGQCLRGKYLTALHFVSEFYLSIVYLSFLLKVLQHPAGESFTQKLQLPMKSHVKFRLMVCALIGRLRDFYLATHAVGLLRMIIPFNVGLKRYALLTLWYVWQYQCHDSILSIRYAFAVKTLQYHKRKKYLPNFMVKIFRVKCFHTTVL